MLELDLRTLTFAMTASSVLLGGSMILLWRTDPRETCLKAWAQGGLLLAIGFLLLWLRGVVSPFWSIPVANTAIAAGYCLLLVGVHLYRGMRIVYWPVLFTVGAVSLSFLYFTYVAPSINARIVIISTVIGTTALWAAYVFAASPPPELRFLQRLAAAVMGLHGTFMLARSLITLGQMPIEDFFAANVVTAATLVEVFIVTVIFTFIFAILIGRRSVLASQKMEHAVRESERRLATLMANLPGMAYRCRNDRDWTMEFVSEGVERLTGYTADEIVGNRRLSYNEVIHPDDRERIWEAAQKALSGRRPFSFRYRIVTAAGTTRSVWEQGRGVGRQTGDVAILEGLVLDVTDQALAEKALRESEERFTKAFRSGPAAMSISGIDDGRYVDVNDAWLVLTGYSRDEVIGRTSAEINIWKEPSQRAAFIDRLLRDGKLHDFAILLCTKSGDVREITLAGDSVEIAGETCILLAHHDMTEQRRIEERLRHAQKMEVVGQLAGGTAHDFNNILQVILASLDLVGRKIKGDESGAKLVDAASRAARRGAKLTQQLLSFSRRQALHPEVIDLNTLVERTAGLLKRTLGGNITIEFLPEIDLPPIHVDEGGLQSAILDLAINARDAMPRGGRLTIRTATKVLDLDMDIDDRTLRAGRYVELSMADNGHGMPQHVLEHAFEPFFTTKEVGQGSGLGLSMVYGFVQQSDGHVTLASEVGKGTMVQMIFPAITGGLEGRHEVAKCSIAVPTRSTVLVVEDDPDVRGSVVALIETLGYDTRVAEESGGALEILDREPSIDLLFTDIVLPGGMNGLELVGEALRRNERLKILVTSGYSETILDQPDVLGVKVSLLRKPYSVEDLRNALRTTLSA